MGKTLAKAFPKVVTFLRETPRSDGATDVTIQLSAAQVSAATWDIHATVCVEASGTGKTMRVQTAPSLDDYPNPPSYSRNCLMQDVLAAVKSQ